MDNELFLQHLRDLPLEEGYSYIQEHALELADYAVMGELLAEEALHQRDANPFLSLKLAELLTYFGEHLHHLPSHALGLKAKGDALSTVGHEQAAMESLDAAGKEFLALGDEMNWARTRIAWIVSCAWIGRAEEALREAARARAVFVRYGEDYWVCIIDHNTAVIYSQMGQYAKALKLYERMLAIYPTLTGKSEALIQRAIAIAKMNRGRNLSWLGKFEEAYRLIEQAQASFITFEQTGLIIATEVNLADLDYAQGYYGSALRRYYQARDILIQQNFDSPIMLASTTLKIAVCLVKLNRAAEACQLAAQAVEVYRQLGASLETGDALREYASTLVASDRSKEALSALDEAWMVFTRGGFEHHASTTRLQQAELLLEVGDVTAAYDQARLLKEYFEAQGLVSRAVRASLVMVGALIERVQQSESGFVEQPELVDQATTLCKQLADLARRYHLREQGYKSQYLLGRLAAISGSAGNAARHYGAAIAQIERMLDDLVYDLSPSFLHTTWMVYEEMIDLCLKQGQAERAFSYLERARSMSLRQYLSKFRTSCDESDEQEGRSNSQTALQAYSATGLRTQHELRYWQGQYHAYSALIADIDASASPTIDQEVIRAELQRCEAKLSELFERTQLQQLGTRSTQHFSHPKHMKNSKDGKGPIDLAQLQQRLLPGQLLLAYFMYKGKLVIFAATAERLVTHEHPGGVAQLERLLPLLHAHLQPAGWSDPHHPPQQVIRRLLNKLYDLLVAPVADLLPPSPGCLTIVPYGPLHKLPFHALFDGAHFLVEDFQVNYLPASSILLQLETSETHAGSTNGYRVSWQPQTSSLETGGSTKRPLLFGYSDNGHLQRALDEAKALAELLDGRCYIEGEATIARLLELAPGSPIIHLATHGHSRLDAPNFSYIQMADGQLNAIDAFNLDLAGCELVTLSGCETGLSMSGGGDEQLGLGRAFLAAGAASLVMSLWPVEDTATNELMQLFYQNLLRGDTKVQALREAQCSLLRQASSIYAHPYFWAAFRLVGEVGPLNIGSTADRHFALQTQPLKK